MVRMKHSSEALHALAQAALEHAGASAPMAAAAARHLVRAEAQGLPTHGMSRVPFYCSMLKNGRADGTARPVPVADRDAAWLVDNRDALPYESCEWAIREVIARAQRRGIAFAGIRASGHIGVLGLHAQDIAQAGLAAFVFSNSPAAIPPWGGTKGLFGTNPVAAAFPRASGDPLVIDLALTTVTRGRIMIAMQKGEKIPADWALGGDGKPTTDPREAAERGSLYPIGGAKGAMLALMFELICSALTGAAISAEADSFFTEKGNRPRIGQAFIAIDPGALAGRERYLERVETLIAAMLAQEGVRLPGTRRDAAARRAASEGMEVPDELIARIRALAQA